MERRNSQGQGIGGVVSSWGRGLIKGIVQKSIAQEERQNITILTGSEVQGYKTKELTSRLTSLSLKAKSISYARQFSPL